MKKLIFSLIFVFIVCFGFISCNKHDFETYSQSEIVQMQYNKAFVNSFGNPSPVQTWGFGNSTSITRSAHTNSNQWGTTEGGGIYANVLRKDQIQPITESELNDVLAVFNKVGVESYTALIDWETFFVQHVYTGTTSHPTHDANQSVIGGPKMNQLAAGWSKDRIDEVNNFNGADGSVMLMMNSSTNDWSYKSSTDNGHRFHYFRMEKINGNYYVGLDFSAEGVNPNEQVDRDFIYNDWIVKVIPGNGVLPPSNEVRIMVEDLSATTGTDFDFNDVVLDVNIVDGNAKCILQAAGGTLPLRINGDDNLEVHKLFGLQQKSNGLYDMVNTNNGTLSKNPVNFVINGITNAANIKFEVFKDNEWIEITAKQGDPAAKFATYQNVTWCNERQSILEKYPDFKQWVQDVNYIWW